MNYKGVIIAESLKDQTVLNSLHNLKARREKVTPKHNTPWLTQWTLHTVEIPENNMDTIAKQLSESIETTHSAWYIDFKNQEFHYIIFPHKVFKINVLKKESYKDARMYGSSLGIPSYQMQFERLKP